MKRLMVFSIMLLLAMAVVAGESVKGKKSPSSSTKKEMKGGRSAGMASERNLINPVAENNFKVDFGNLPDVQWSKSGIFDEASFVKDGIHMTAFYDFNGTLVGSTAIKKFSDLPKSAQQSIKSEYKDYKIGTVMFYDDLRAFPEEIYLYGQRFDSSDNWFVELKKEARTIVLKVSPDGEIFLFSEL